VHQTAFTAKLLKNQDLYIRNGALTGLAEIKSEKAMVELNKVLNNRKFLQTQKGSYYCNALDLLRVIQSELGCYQLVTS